MPLSSAQLEIIKIPLPVKIFLAGPAGCGKTTVGVERLRDLLAHGVPADAVLVLTPQRSLQAPYESLLRDPGLGPGGLVTLATVGGLARRMLELFWPLAAAPAGFSHPEQPPTFLTLETAQYYMARLVRPLLDQGFFASVTIDRNRLCSQILDNLNKSAAVAFPAAQIGVRLESAWAGEAAQRHVYSDVQECATRFRGYCLEHNLLDFSLQLEVFRDILWQAPACQDYLTHEYHHLIYDNIEEDFPVAHDLILDWLPKLDSALLIYDEEAGYRRFLGADPDSALRLADGCSEHPHLQASFVINLALASWGTTLAKAIDPASSISPLIVERNTATPSAGAGLVLPPADRPTRFFPQMLDLVAEQIQGLVETGLAPSEIVVLSPFLSDSLRFSLASRLEAVGIPWRSQRPSRSLRDEPASRCLLTLSELAHPAWEIRPTKPDLALALLYALEGMDLVRARLLAEIVYRPKDLSLSSFDRIQSEVQERISYSMGVQYEALRAWLENARDEKQRLPLDAFLRCLFGEALSQKGFRFHRDLDAARVASSLIESVGKFRQAMQASADPDLDAGREYLVMLQEGVIAAQYLESGQMQETEAVLLAPAHTFLMMNRSATVQIWLDPSSSGWWERLFQPLTQPYVLSRTWVQGRVWGDGDEVATNQEMLKRMVIGLLRRCRGQVMLALSDLGEAGVEKRGPLLRAIWKTHLANQTLPNS
jgi:hypothetical protein